MPNELSLEEQLAIAEKATPGEWWVAPDIDPLVGTLGYNVLIGDQDDRVCECHDEECKPKENAAFISLARTGYPAALRKLIRLRELLGPYLEGRGQGPSLMDSGTVPAEASGPAASGGRGERF